MSLLPGGRCRDIVTRTGGAVDQPEQGVGAIACEEAIVCCLCADGPSVLRLMTGKAGAAVGAQVLEEGVTRGHGCAARLIGGDAPAWIAIGFKFRYHRRSLLHALARIRKHPHSLCVLDCG